MQDSLIIDISGRKQSVPYNFCIEIVSKSITVGWVYDQVCPATTRVARATPD